MNQQPLNAMKRNPLLIIVGSALGHAVLARALAYNTATTDALWKEGETSGDDRELRDDGRGIASNVADPVSEDEWIRIAKYGEWRDGSPARVLQVLALENASKMAASFNSLPGRLGRLFRGAPIYVGHPDCKPDVFTDHRRIGKIVALDARADGLWAKPVWNALGQENLREGYHVYPSSVWRFPKPKPGQSKVYPDLFQSLGLTNTPAGDVDPVTFNAEIPDADGGETEPTNPQNEDMKKLYELLKVDEALGEDGLIAAIMGLQEAVATNAKPAEGATTTEEEMVEETDEEKKQLILDLEAEKAKRETAENAVRAMRTAERDRLIGAAVAGGAITEAERTGWTERFDTNHEAARNALESLQPGTAMNTKPLNLGKGKVATATAQERMAAVNAEVARLQEEKGLSYNAAWNEVANSDEFKPVFAAMAEPVTAEVE